MNEPSAKFTKSTIKGLIKAAGILGRSARNKSEVAILEDILEQRHDEATLKSLYWASMRNFDLPLAAKTLEEIKPLVGTSKEKSLWFKKASAGPLEGIALADRLVEQHSVAKLASEPRRILYVLHNSLPFSSGGYATRAHGVASGLRQAGIDVICTTRPGYPHDIPGDHDGRDVSPINIIDGIPYHVISEPVRSGHGAVAYMTKSVEAIARAIELHRPSCVISASNHLTAIPACIAARQFGLPFIYEVRGFWEVTRLSREPEFKNTTFYKMQLFYETAVAKAADHVLTLTGPMRDELISRGVVRDNITLAPNSCDISRFSPTPRNRKLASELGIQPDVPVIGYIGSFVQYEGLEHLVQAAALLRDRDLDFRLMLVGSENASGNEQGPITEEIMRIAETENIGDKLILPGRVPHKEVEAYYSLIDIAPFPRKPQPVTEMVSPMKPLEAFAMEKAVVVSSVKALEEMVRHRETGMIFQKGSIQALADTLEELITSPTLRKRLGKSARSWVESERTWQVTIDKALTDMRKNGIKALSDQQPLHIEDGDEVRRDVEPVLDQDDITLPASWQPTYDRVKAQFDERDAKLGSVSFSANDWLRTKIAFSLFGGAERVIDIGIGQGQLVNLFSNLPHIKRVIGVDRVRHSKHLAPQSKAYEFVSLDVTETFPEEVAGADVTIAMEIFEHIDADKVSEAIERARTSSRTGMLFASVPYQEKHPLYHHDKPYGHKQSFDDAKVLECFGKESIWTNLNNSWYLIFCAPGLEKKGRSTFEEFDTITRELFESKKQKI